MFALLPLIVALLHAAPAARVSQEKPPPTALKHVSLSRDGSVAVVTLDATGRLPDPVVGQLENPSRIYFDFTDVIARTSGIPSTGHPIVHRVRVAQHTVQPSVTRVVLDLSRMEVFRLDTEHLEDGRLRVIVGEVAPSQAAEPADVPPPDRASNPPADRPPELPPERPPPVPEPPKPESSLPPREVARYRAQIAEPLSDAVGLRTILAVIDRLATPAAHELEAAGDELVRIRHAIAAVKPPDSLRQTHDYLLAVCTLGAMATRLRAEANVSSDITHVRNAGAAAAGARLLLDRVCAEIGCDAR